MHFYNISLKSIMYPEEFKIARIKPMYTKEYVHNVQNYWPVSLLSIFSKILEYLYLCIID